MKSFKTLALLILNVNMVLYAGDLPLSFEKEELLHLKRQKIEQDASKDRNSWVSPVLLSVTADKSEDASGIESTNKDVSLNWSQDLFRSGGIFAAIDKANASKEFNLLGIDQEEANYLKQIYMLKTQLERDKLSYRQSTLTLKNREIDFQVIKAKYEVGNADINQLNRTTLDLDNAKTELVSIQNIIDTDRIELQKLIKEKKTNTITLPTIRLVSQREYVKNHLELMQYNAKIKSDDATYKIVDAGYLPKVTLNTSVGYRDYEGDRIGYDGTNYSYGMSVSMPFDINAKASKESAKLQLLQTKIAKLDRQKEIEKEYRKHLLSIKNFKAKIKIAKEMQDTYQNLYQLAKNQKKAGIKTSYDVMSLKNSLAIQKLEAKIQAYNILIEKITLYFDMKQ